MTETSIEAAKTQREADWKAAYERLGEKPPEKDESEPYDGRSLWEKLQEKKVSLAGWTGCDCAAGSEGLRDDEATARGVGWAEAAVLSLAKRTVTAFRSGSALEPLVDQPHAPTPVILGRQHGEPDGLAQASCICPVAFTNVRLYTQDTKQAAFDEDRKSVV